MVDIVALRDDGEQPDPCEHGPSISALQRAIAQSVPAFDPSVFERVIAAWTPTVDFSAAIRGATEPLQRATLEAVGRMTADMLRASNCWSWASPMGPDTEPQAVPPPVLSRSDSVDWEWRYRLLYAIEDLVDELEGRATGAVAEEDGLTEQAPFDPETPSVPNFPTRYPETYRGLWGKLRLRPHQVEAAAELGIHISTLKRYREKKHLPWPPDVPPPEA